MATTTIEKPFFEFTAFCRETEEVHTCTNLKVLYDAVRRDFRIWPEEKRTVLFFKNLENWEFDSAIPFFKMEHSGTE